MKNIWLKGLVVLAVFLIFSGIAGVAATFIYFWAGVINIGTSDSITLMAIVKLLLWTMLYGLTSYGMIIFGAYMGQEVGNKID